jgi:hypothetical protein
MVAVRSRRKAGSGRREDGRCGREEGNGSRKEGRCGREEWSGRREEAPRGRNTEEPGCVLYTDRRRGQYSEKPHTHIL